MDQTEQEKRLNEEADLKAEDNQQEEAGNSKKISGYALKFGEPSKDLGGFTEVITPEALKDVDLSDVFLLQNHDYSKPLASTKAGTLQLNIDDVGLQFEAELNDSSYAKDTFENIDKGLVDSMSFGFTLGMDSFDKSDNGEITRSIEQIKGLNEISVVTVPAYDSTNVQVNTRSYEAFIDQLPTKQTENVTELTYNTQKEGKNMEKTLISNEMTEVKGFEDYVRTQGEQRDGITTENASAVIPKDVIGEVFELKRDGLNLAQYTTIKNVNNGQGSYPIATNQLGTLATKKELENIADINAEMFTAVDYKVETRAGKIFLSEEVISDSEVNIVAEIKDQLAKMVENTDNANIMALLKTFTKKEASTLDDLKTIVNVDLDPALSLTVIMNQSGFNELDLMKDQDGRYILQPDVTAPSGKSLFGLPVVKVSNKLLPNSEAGKMPMIIGDLQQSVFIARRNQVTAQWQAFDNYSQGLSVVLRNDYKKIDEEASVYVEFTAEVEAP